MDNQRKYVIGYLGSEKYENGIREFVSKRFAKEGYTVIVTEDLEANIPNCIVYNMDEISIDKIKELAERTGLRAFIPITTDKAITKEFADEYSKSIFEDGSVRLSPTNIGSDEKDDNSNFNRFLRVNLVSRIIGHCEVLQNGEKDNLTAIKKITDNFFDVMSEDSPITKTHSEMVGTFNEFLAREMAWDYDAIQIARYIGLLHDVGKANGMITVEVNKGEPTTDMQQAKIDEHSAGGDILDSIFKDKEKRGATLHHSTHTDILQIIADKYKVNDEGLTLAEYTQKHLQDYSFVSITRTSDSFHAMTAYRGYNNPLNIVKACLEMYKNTIIPRPRDGKIQFESSSVEALLVLLAKETGSLGYDLRAMINAVKENDEFMQYYEKQGYDDNIINGVLSIFDEHRDEIVIERDANQGEFCNADFTITPEGLIRYKNDLAEISYEKRLEAEWNKKLMSAIGYKKTSKMKDFKEVLKSFELPSFREWMEKKNNGDKLDDSKETLLEECLKKAQHVIEMEDRIARECVRIGYTQTPRDVVEAARKQPPSFNGGTYTQAMRAIGHDFEKYLEGFNVASQQRRVVPMDPMDKE